MSSSAEEFISDVRSCRCAERRRGSVCDSDWSRESCSSSRFFRRSHKLDQRDSGRRTATCRDREPPTFCFFLLFWLQLQRLSALFSLCSNSLNWLKSDSLCSMLFLQICTLKGLKGLKLLSGMQLKYLIAECFPFYFQSLFQCFLWTSNLLELLIGLLLSLQVLLHTLILFEFHL